MTDKPKRMREKKPKPPVEPVGPTLLSVYEMGDVLNLGPVIRIVVDGPLLPPGFVDVETTQLVELDSVPTDSAPMHERADFDQAVSGALVKVAPVLRASERDGFVDADARRRVLEAGARACVIRPVIVPDVAAKAEPERARLNPRDELRRWVGEHMPAARDEVLDALLVHCDRILSEVGL